MKKKYRNRPEKWPETQEQRWRRLSNEPPRQLRFRSHDDAMKFMRTSDITLAIDPYAEPDAYRDAPYAQTIIWGSHTFNSAKK